MDRRNVFRSMAGVLLTALVADAQQRGGGVPRIGVLTFTGMTAALQEAFRQGLRDHGYIEGRNVLLEWLAAEGRTDRAKVLAVELVQLRVDIIVASFTPAVQAAKDATRAIPIVMARAGDPAGTGLVASLARPGGNITGISSISAEMSSKRIQLLRELIPGLTRIGLLINAADPFAKPFVEETQAAAKRTGVRFHIVDVRRPPGDRRSVFRDDEAGSGRRDRSRSSHRTCVAGRRVSGTAPLAFARRPETVR
jgi:putative ABC transport system substrate-binding protein